MAVHVRFMLDKVTVVQIILRGLGSSPLTIIPAMLCVQSAVNVRMGNWPIRGRNSIAKISPFTRTKLKNKRGSANGI
jgi:hypothetical protein